MKTVSIEELKARLSALLGEATAGARILVTRHGLPVAILSPPERDSIHVGKRFGRGRMHPLLHEATGGLYLDVLDEDRGDERFT